MLNIYVSLVIISHAFFNLSVGDGMRHIGRH